MRMRDGDRRETAQRLDHLDDGLVEQRQTVPEHVSAARAHEKRALADGEVRLDADADETRLFLLDRVAVREPQTLEGGPLLTGGLDVLALVVADGTCGRRLLALGELGAARRADEAGHGPRPRANRANSTYTILQQPRSGGPPSPGSRA